MTTFDIHEGRSRSLLRKPLVSSGGAVGGGVGPYDSRFSFARPFAEFVCRVGVNNYLDKQRLGRQSRALCDGRTRTIWARHSRW